MYHTEPPTDKTIREWYMNSSRVAAYALRNEQAVRAYGSVWYMIRNLRCTVTTDSVLANSKSQNAFLFTVNAIFRQSRLPPSGGTWKYAKAPSTKKLGEILYLLICSFLPCLS